MIRLPPLEFKLTQNLSLLAVKELTTHDNGEQVLIYFVGPEVAVKSKEVADV